MARDIELEQKLLSIEKSPFKSSTLLQVVLDYRGIHGSHPVEIFFNSSLGHTPLEGFLNASIERIKGEGVKDEELIVDHRDMRSGTVQIIFKTDNAFNMFKKHVAENIKTEKKTDSRYSFYQSDKGGKAQKGEHASLLTADNVSNALNLPADLAISEIDIAKFYKSVTFSTNNGSKFFLQIRRLMETVDNEDVIISAANPNKVVVSFKAYTKLLDILKKHVESQEIDLATKCAL